MPKTLSTRQIECLIAYHLGIVPLTIQKRFEGAQEICSIEVEERDLNFLDKTKLAWFEDEFFSPVKIEFFYLSPDTAQT